MSVYSFYFDSRPEVQELVERECDVDMLATWRGLSDKLFEEFQQKVNMAKIEHVLGSNRLDVNASRGELKKYWDSIKHVEVNFPNAFDQFKTKERNPTRFMQIYCQLEGNILLLQKYYK